MGKDVIIACDFSTKKDVMQFLDRFTQKKALCQDRYGAVLCRGTTDRTRYKGARPQDIFRFKASRHPQHRKEGDVSFKGFGCRHDEPSCRWNNRDDESRFRGANAP